MEHKFYRSVLSMSTLAIPKHEFVGRFMPGFVRDLENLENLEIEQKLFKVLKTHEINDLTLKSLIPNLDI